MAKRAPELNAVPFDKYHGTGNDFIIIDGRYGLPFEIPALAPVICHRRFGVGADGLIVLEISSLGEFRMRYVNADGSAAVCGNGTRCLAHYIYAKGLIERDCASLKLETDRETQHVELRNRAERILVDMGEAVFDGLRIPTTEPGEHLGKVISIGERSLKIHAVSMGNPHCVMFVDHLTDEDVLGLGPALERHSFFPERTNVEFVRVCSEDLLKIRIWERGVGETLACGTGACASFAVAHRLGLVGRSATVVSPGGAVEVVLEDNSPRLGLFGAVEHVYSGTIDIERLVASFDKWKIEVS